MNTTLTRFDPRDTHDTIDTRDLHEWIRDAQYGLQLTTSEVAAADTEEIAYLAAALNEISGYSGEDTSYGVTLVADSYFTDYVQEYAEEIGAYDPQQSSFLVIDWDRTADFFRMDYTSIEIYGTTYWYR